MAKPSPFLIQGRLSQFSHIAHKSDVQREMTKIKREKPKVKYSVSWIMTFLAAKRENRKLEYLPQADFGRVTVEILCLQGNSQ